MSVPSSVQTVSATMRARSRPHQFHFGGKIPPFSRKLENFNFSLDLSLSSTLSQGIKAYFEEGRGQLMEGSKGEAVFDSLNLNPQLFINEALNVVDDLVDDAFDFYQSYCSLSRLFNLILQFCSVNFILANSCSLQTSIGRLEDRGRGQISGSYPGEIQVIFLEIFLSAVEFRFVE